MKNCDFYTLRNLADCIHDEAIFALELVEKYKEVNKDNENFVNILEDVILILRKATGWAGCISWNLRSQSVCGYGVAINLSETLATWSERLLCIFYVKIRPKYKRNKDCQNLNDALSRVSRRVHVLSRLFSSQKEGNGK